MQKLGRRNKQYSKDLKQQIQYKLEGMLKAGEGTSKKEAILTDSTRDKIFSYSTYKTYFKHCRYFANYIKEYHPECTTLKAAKKYVNEWLQFRADQVDENGNHLSAWTIQTEAKAVGKLYGLEPSDKNYFKPPIRRREDIKRSRGDAVRDKHFSERNNDEIVKFCKALGPRRRELEEIRGKDLITREKIEDQIKILEQKNNLSDGEIAYINTLKDTRLFSEAEYFVHIRNGKGGRERFSPILGDNKEKIIERMKNTSAEEKVFQHVPTNMDVHGYRGDYATLIYKAVARPINKIPYDKVNKGTGKKYQGDVYVCRKDERKKKLDRQAMYICSKALGHNRVSVVADNYIRGL